MNVGKEQFRPPQKVDSSVVVFEPKGWPEGLDPEDWDALLRMLFSGKNKTLRSLLMGNKHMLSQLAAAGEGSLGEEVAALRAAAQPGDKVVTTSAATLPSTVLQAVKERLGRVLLELDASLWRPNAMPLHSFQSLYGALKGEGFVFKRGLGAGEESRRQKKIGTRGKEEEAGGILMDMGGLDEEGGEGSEDDGLRELTPALQHNYSTKTTATISEEGWEKLSQRSASVAVSLTEASITHTPGFLPIPGGRLERRLSGWADVKNK